MKNQHFYGLLKFCHELLNTKSSTVPLKAPYRLQKGFIGYNFHSGLNCLILALRMWSNFLLNPFSKCLNILLKIEVCRWCLKHTLKLMQLLDTAIQLFGVENISELNNYKILCRLQEPLDGVKFINE